MTDRPLEGKRALVTGASRGIGRAIALGFAEAGADVALLARSADLLETVATEVKDRGRQGLPVVCDITDLDRIDEAVTFAADGLGGLDIVVNNAGGMDFSGAFLDLTDEDWTRTRTLNLDATFRLLHRTGRRLTAQGAGSVLNVASIAGLGGVPRLAHYAMCKAAMLSLTQTLAAEWAQHGVRVNAIAPGWIHTDLTRSFSGHPEANRLLTGDVPQGRFGEPEDLVDAAVYLAGDTAGMVTGATLTIDGGLTAQVSPALRDLLALGRAPL